MSLGQYIAGRWMQAGGRPFSSADPATSREIWKGTSATKEDIDRAVEAARSALNDWRSMSTAERIGYLQIFKKTISEIRVELAQTISSETGKPMWESLGEVDAMASKVSLSIEARQDRRKSFRQNVEGVLRAVHYRPIGVVAVLGPYNMPGHIPNGHIIPALLEGNTVIFKPSEYTPLVGQKITELWEGCGLPAGVFNLVQGGSEAGGWLASAPGVDGLFFTGSYETGRALHRIFGGHPEKMLALELGGNNPLVVFGIKDVDAAVILSLLSAYLTTGQRCTCARRLIVQNDTAGDLFLRRMDEAIHRIRIGPYTDRPEPFCGPVISKEAANRLLVIQQQMITAGAKPIVAMRPTKDRETLLRPGLIDVTDMTGRTDSEWFGPFLQVVRVADFNDAVAEANKTAYGLAAGLLSDNPRLYDQFAHQVAAGHMVWNRQTTGASSSLPFGGLGLSGNHRPSGYFAIDYCSDPVASLASPTLELPATLPPGLVT